MKFILFIMTIAYSDDSMAAAEFNSFDACEAARVKAIIEFGVRGTAVRGFCAEKGESK